MVKKNRKEFLKILGLSGLSGFFGLGFKPFKQVHPLIKPKPLKEGDTIGLVSPASILPERKMYGEVERSIKKLGFKVKLGKHAKARYGNLAGHDVERAADLTAMFADPGVHAIIPFRGGWGSNRILDLIDFELIEKNPKPLIGFSDITSLLLSIYAKTGLVTYHGPVGKSNWTDLTVSYFRKALMEGQPFEMKNTVANKRNAGVKVSTITPGKAKGRLLGGNLTVLTSMIGSGYLPDWKGSILFVEDVGEDYYRIDRMLTQLKLNGMLQQLNGFIFGRCTNCEKGNDYSLSLEQILKDHIKPLRIPSFYGSMIGHIDKMFTIPVGISGEINANDGTIKLLETPTI